MPTKPDQQRECKRHGLTAYKYEPSKSGTGYRCRKCSVEFVTEKRRALKRRLVDHLGGECSACGYAKCLEALHFHHVGTKTDVLSSLIGSYRSKKAWIEVEHCVLLCANCHAEEHSQTMRPVGIEPTSLGLQPSA